MMADDRRLTDLEIQALRHEITEGCREMADIYLEVNREWAPLDDELWAAIEK